MSFKQSQSVWFSARFGCVRQSSFDPLECILYCSLLVSKCQREQAQRMICEERGVCSLESCLWWLLYMITELRLFELAKPFEDLLYMQWLMLRAEVSSGLVALGEWLSGQGEGGRVVGTTPTCKCSRLWGPAPSLVWLSMRVTVCGVCVCMYVCVCVCVLVYKLVTNYKMFTKCSIYSVVCIQ